MIDLRDILHALNCVYSLFYNVAYLIDGFIFITVGTAIVIIFVL